MMVKSLSTNIDIIWIIDWKSSSTFPALWLFASDLAVTCREVVDLGT